ncbi:MAG TPA: transferase [Luteimonas sp.]|nr:transferase [Luteimonas sp.]
MSPRRGWPGDLWARLRAFRKATDPLGVALPRARLLRYDGYAALQFRRGQTQSRMRTAEPDALLIDYTRSMLGCLLFRPEPVRIGIIGMGGGSQVKFCHRYLPGTRLEVAENHPGVIALRHAFGIPDDDARLQVVLDDGARFLRARPGRYDLLLVDGYDDAGIPEALSTQAYYDACRAALVEGGAMASNLHCADSEAHVARLRRSFGHARVRVIGEARMKNQVAFAWTAEPADEALAVAVSVLTEDARGVLEPILRRVAAAIAADG